jgi:hypothetical protein
MLWNEWLREDKSDVVVKSTVSGTCAVLFDSPILISRFGSL